MTGRLAASSGWTGFWAVVVAITCAGMGLALLVAATALGLPALAPAVAAAALVIPLLVVRPVAVLVLVTVVEAGNLSSVGAENGIPRGESLLLGLAVVAAVLAWARGHVRPGWSPFLTAGLIYLLVQAVAALAADDVNAAVASAALASTGVAAVAETAKALLWPVVVFALLLVPGRTPLHMARAFALTLAILSGLTLFQEFVLGNATTFAGLSNVPLVADLGGATARHAGPQGDPNFWARVLVLGIPFALSLARMASSRLGAVAWTGAAGLIGAGVVLTGSRGGLLAAFVVVCVWALLTGGRVAKALVLTPLAAGLVLFIPGVGSRLLTLGSIGAGEGLELADPSLEGRLAAQRVAVEMVVDDPLFGVGPGNFLPVESDYLRRLTLDTIPLAPHNQYLEAAAESGLPGLAAWLVLLGTAAVVTLRARLLARTYGGAVDRDAPASLANAVLAALAGWAVASTFLHLATFRTFLFVAVLGAALDLRARRRVTQVQRDIADGVISEPPVRAAPGRDRPGTGLRVTAGVLSLSLLALSAVLWATGGREDDPARWSATTSMQLVVANDGVSDSPAYDQDTLSRAGLIRTLGGIATSPRFVEEGTAAVAAAGGRTEGVEVAVTGSVQSALIVVNATGPDYDGAAAVALAVRDAAAAFIESVSPLYNLRPDESGAIVVPAARPFDRGLAVWPLAGAGVVAVALVVAGRHRRDEVPQHPERQLTPVA